MERFFQTAKRQVPPFSANFHPSVQNQSTFQLIYQKLPNNGHYVEYERLPIEEFSENGGSIPHN
jgi:hypothetical protein